MRIPIGVIRVFFLIPALYFEAQIINRKKFSSITHDSVKSRKDLNKQEYAATFSSEL